MKLNIGCGTDYRNGFINIDGSSEIGADKTIDMSLESLLSYFETDTVDYILANDILEHHFHWEAVNILKDFYALLNVQGLLEIRVPDCEYIIENQSMDLNKKMLLLYGGQDIPQGNSIMDESRKNFPQYFCHKYGWTKKTLGKVLVDIGYRNLKFVQSGVNIICTSVK